MSARAANAGMAPRDAAVDEYIAALLDGTPCPGAACGEAQETMQPVADDSSVYYLCGVAGLQLAIAKQAVAQVGAMPQLAALGQASPAWLLGTTTQDGQVCHAVDVAHIIAPGSPARALPACAIVLADSRWLLAVDAIDAELLLVGECVRWRENRRSRPWLAGMASEPLCAVLDIAGLSELLSREWQRDAT